MNGVTVGVGTPKHSVGEQIPTLKLSKRALDEAIGDFASTGAVGSKQLIGPTQEDLQKSGNADVLFDLFAAAGSTPGITLDKDKGRGRTTKSAGLTTKLGR